MNIEQGTEVWTKQGEPDALVHIIYANFKKDSSIEYIVNISALLAYLETKDPTCSFQIFPKPTVKPNTGVPLKKRRVETAEDEEVKLEDPRFIYSSIIIETSTSRVIVSCRNGIGVQSLVSMLEAEHLYHKWLNRAILCVMALPSCPNDLRASILPGDLKQCFVAARGFVSLRKEGVLKKQGAHPDYFRAVTSLPLMHRGFYDLAFKHHFPKAAVSYDEELKAVKAVLGQGQNTVIILAMPDGSIWSLRRIREFSHVEDHIEKIVERIRRIRSLSAEVPALFN